MSYRVTESEFLLESTIFLRAFICFFILPAASHNYNHASNLELGVGIVEMQKFDLKLD